MRLDPRPNLRFVDLFAGLGGFHQALADLGHEFIFASEIDSELRQLYQANFRVPNEAIAGDIRTVDPSTIPPHDILCAGFPCQPFSKAGYQLGWEDEIRGTLFENVVNILKAHEPKYVILENVGNFERHDNGKTWQTVRSSLEALGYNVKATEHKASGGPGLVSPHHLGFPHHRERFYMVASKDELPPSLFPPTDRARITDIKSITQRRLSKIDREETELSTSQIDCINHWNKFLRFLPEKEVPHLPSFPIWGDEFGATYPYEEMTPQLLSAEELGGHLQLNGQGTPTELSKDVLLNMLPAYATRSAQFPDWKIKFIRQNREWFREIADRIPDSWTDRLKEFPPSLRKLEWNCKGEKRDLWEHILQFRSSGLRVKRYQNSPSLVSMTSTQIPILGPKKRFITKREGLKLQGFPESFKLPSNRTETFKALGNAVHVGVIKEITRRLQS